MTSPTRDPVAVLAALRGAIVQGQFYGAWAMLTDQQKQDAWQWVTQHYPSRQIYMVEAVREGLERERDEKGD